MHPCCNGSLQTGVKIIAIVQLVLSILLCLLGILSLSFGGLLTTFGLEPGKDNATSSEETNLFNSTTGLNGKDSISDKETVVIIGAALMIVSVILIIAGVVSILISIVLLVGANKRNRTLCMIWFVLEVISFVVAVISVISDIFTGGSVGNIFMNIAFLALSGYFLWVVWAFMEEIKGGVAVSPYGNPKARV